MREWVEILSNSQLCFECRPRCVLSVQLSEGCNLELDYQVLYSLRHRSMRADLRV